MRSTYVTVKIPAELASKVDDYVLSDLGYRSRAEVVNDAIRHFIDERRAMDRVAEAASRRDSS
jgi:metal-responsive CopG/Arc/MetJ family transcriptional regulator